MVVILVKTKRWKKTPDVFPLYLHLAYNFWSVVELLNFNLTFVYAFFSLPVLTVANFECNKILNYVRVNCSQETQLQGDYNHMSFQVSHCCDFALRGVSVNLEIVMKVLKLSADCILGTVWLLVVMRMHPHYKVFH